MPTRLYGTPRFTAFFLIGKYKGKGVVRVNARYGMYLAYIVGGK